MEENKMILDTLDRTRANKLLTDEQAVRFIVVQHPFSRLVKLFKNIFDKRNHYGKNLLSEYSYIKDFVSHSTDDLEEILDFRDFIDYLTHETGSKSVPDFRPATTLCEPCTNPFDLVIKHEAPKTDINHLLKLGYNIPPQLQNLLPEDNAGNNQPELIDMKDEKLLNKKNQAMIADEIKLVQKYFGMLEKTTLLKLKQLYFWDFKLYGYTFDTNTLTIGGLD